MATTQQIDRLKSQLLTSGVQQQNQALFQVIDQLINSLRATAQDVNNITSGGGGSSSTVINITNGAPTLVAFDGIDGQDGISNLPGPIGPIGPNGAQGNAGMPGFPIYDGLDGEDGFGFPGIQGSAGSNITNLGVANLTLTAAQIRTLNSVPIDLVSAQGINNVIVPLWWISWYVATSTAFSADASFSIRWNGLTTVLFIPTSFVLNSATPGNQFKDVARSTINFGKGGNDPRNLSLQLRTTADVTLGTGNVFNTSVFYYITNW